MLVDIVNFMKTKKWTKLHTYVKKIVGGFRGKWGKETNILMSFDFFYIVLEDTITMHFSKKINDKMYEHFFIEWTTYNIKNEIIKELLHKYGL